MTKLFFAVVALATTTSAIAGPAPTTHRFSRDGQTYVYTTTTSRSRQVIDGYSLSTGGRFHLIVRNAQVSGESNGVPVSFRVATPATTVQTALR